MNSLPYTSALKPSFLVVYRDYQYSGSSRRVSHVSRMNLSLAHSSLPKSNFSHKSKQRLKNVLNWMVLAAVPKRIRDRKCGMSFRFKINFVTLTLPLMHNSPSDRDVKSKLLNQLLTEFRKSLPEFNYVWKAEVQANGMIHFHLSTDTFIHWKFIRECWNRIINKEGFIDEYERRMIAHHNGGFNPFPNLYPSWPLCRQYKNYILQKKHGFRNPNSIDVHAVKNVKNWAGYVCKYMLKSENGKRPVEGRVWGCSQKLSKVNNIKIPITGEEWENDFYRWSDSLENINTEFAYILKFKNSDLKCYKSNLYVMQIYNVIQFLRHKSGYEFCENTNTIVFNELFKS